MDEGADMALEEVETAEEERLDYITGKMSDAEACERGIIDENGTLIGTEKNERSKTNKKDNKRSPKSR